MVITFLKYENEVILACLKLNVLSLKWLKDQVATSFVNFEKTGIYKRGVW